ncbi:hypothetical protein V5799_004895 [Amblyomma americanum]|uniref:MAM domain-containing protein n=1 Tax=Amblyomma americanum TaxID=6943 RepID=A0AAQ4D4T8_AMBAM
MAVKRNVCFQGLPSLDSSEGIGPTGASWASSKEFRVLSSPSDVTSTDDCDPAQSLAGSAPGSGDSAKLYSDEETLTASSGASSNAAYVRGADYQSRSSSTAAASVSLLQRSGTASTAPGDRERRVRRVNALLLGFLGIFLAACAAVVFADRRWNLFAGDAALPAAADGVAASASAAPASAKLRAAASTVAGQTNEGDRFLARQLNGLGMSLIVRWLSVCYCVVLITSEEPDCGFEIPVDDVTHRMASEEWNSSSTEQVLVTNRTSRAEDTDLAVRDAKNVTSTTTTDLSLMMDFAPTVTSLLEKEESVVLSLATTEESTSSTPEASLSSAKLERDFLQREKRQDEEEEEEVEKFIAKPEPCDFGQAEEISMCDWTNYFNATPKMAWKPGKGDTALWLGGPRTDHTLNTGEGGYVFFETSFHERPGPSIVSAGDTAAGAAAGAADAGAAAGAGMADTPAPTSATAVTTRAPQMRQYQYESVVLATRNITPTGPQGFCVSFFYALEGLSVDRLKVVIMDAETQENITVWESQDNYDGRWTKGEVAYTYGDVHQVWFEAVPKQRGDPSRRFRGYIALDDILFDRMEEAGDNCLGA